MMMEEMIQTRIQEGSFPIGKIHHLRVYLAALAHHLLLPLYATHPNNVQTLPIMVHHPNVVAVVRAVRN